MISIKNNNSILLKKELEEREYIKQNPDILPDFIYPIFSDPNFNIKIAEKYEFNETQYNGTIYPDIKKQADLLSNADFELQPHQLFVKNYLSKNTAYNSLLLMHGVGTGKTCSAIGVTEEYRISLKETNIDADNQKILIVASENVQENFKLQLFDEKKLKNINGIWTIDSCVGNNLLKEINPTNIEGLTIEKISQLIKNIIKSNYIFMGYVQFANYIKNILMGKNDNINPPLIENNINKNIKEENIENLRKRFSNQMIVIDEIHNIRKDDESDKKKISIYLDLLVKYVRKIKYIFLSATPMFNGYKEIIWLLNIMNQNDDRATMKISDIFDMNGNFKENGKEILIAKSTGYISYIRGENPYTFPYRIYPSLFDKSHTFNDVLYPNYQMNLKRILPKDKKRIVDNYLIFLNECSSNCNGCQYCAYRYIINYLRRKSFNYIGKNGEMINTFNFNDMDSFSYTILQLPIESLIISYPIDNLKETLLAFEPEPELESEPESNPEPESEPEPPIEDITTFIDIKKNINELTDSKKKLDLKFNPNILTGKGGLDRMMKTIKLKDKYKYDYKPETIKKYGRIFSFDNIKKYSSKIYTILDQIKKSKGVVLIYSQYIEGGIVPMILALEEFGFIRYGKEDNNLLQTNNKQYIDALTMKPPNNNKNFNPARYIAITGNSRLSPNNIFDIKGITNENNKNGEIIKVVLVSKTGAEGIDLKFIRQVHILEPWYNLNRIEQIIGRAVRNFSHKDLPFEERNVQIFMYGTILENLDEETADLYIYRIAEQKAIKIGEVSRVLKENAVDCILNSGQKNFTSENMSKILKYPITQILSDGFIINDFKVGDQSYSTICDYMEDCDYKCNMIDNKINVNMDTYNENFIYLNFDKICERIKKLMEKEYFYKKDKLIDEIKRDKNYSLIQIYAALTYLIESKNDKIMDKYGRLGFLQNIGDYYLFFPEELTYKHATIFERNRPIDLKMAYINFKYEQLENIPQKNNLQNDDNNSNIHSILYENFQLFMNGYNDISFTQRHSNWYFLAGKIMAIFLNGDNYKIKSSILQFLSKEKIEKYIVEHILESISEKYQIINIINYIFNLYSPDKKTHLLENNEFSRIAVDINSNATTTDQLSIFNNHVKNYYTSKIVKISIPNQYIDYDIIPFYEYSQNELVYLYSDKYKKKWIELDKNTIIEYNIQQKIEHISIIHKSNYNDIIGFMGYIQKTDMLLFKIINLTAKRDMGYVCEQAGKKKVLELLNNLLNEEVFTKYNTKIGNIVLPKDLCIIQEFIFRYFNDIKLNQKKWYIDPSTALINKIYKLYI